MEVTPASIPDATLAAVTTPAEKIDVAATRKLGILGWLCIGWIVAIVGSAILAPILPLSDPEKSVAGLARQVKWQDTRLP